MTKTKNNSGNIMPKYHEMVNLGQIIFTKTPERYNMLGLGTCLGIFLYDIKKNNYMIAHTLLPKYTAKRNRSSKPLPGRFTDVALHSMVNKLVKKGSNKRDIKCKIVGGGKIFNDEFEIGKKNFESAKDVLHEENISLVGKDIGGTTSRSIMGFQSDGDLYCKKKGEYYFI